jgi:disulfide bond formation protein DsbB
MQQNRRLGLDRRHAPRIDLRFTLKDWVSRGALFGLLVSGGLLIGAYGFQYIGGLMPCEMCLWQRIPHWVMLFFGAGVLALHYRQNFQSARLLLGACSIIALISSGLGLWHLGVEQKWWPSPIGCSVTQGVPDFLNMHIVYCDEPQWQLFGISMAGYNALISLGLAAILGFCVWRKL